MEFRNLKPSDIELRVKTCKKGGTSFLLYKNARCDMNVLDESVGSSNWQRHHTRNNANCIISIWDEDKKQWIEKEDTGTETYSEKEKGIASDSFKRAGFNWGIGRELYTAPFIYISSNILEVENYNGKYKPSGFPALRVSKVKTTKDKVIRQLEIRDKNDNVMYSWIDPRNKKLHSLIKKYSVEKVKKISEDNKISSVDISYDELDTLENQLKKEA